MEAARQLPLNVPACHRPRMERAKCRSDAPVPARDPVTFHGMPRRESLARLARNHVRRIRERSPRVAECNVVFERPFHRDGRAAHCAAWVVAELAHGLKLARCAYHGDPAIALEKACAAVQRGLAAVQGSPAAGRSTPYDR